MVRIQQHFEALKAFETCWEKLFDNTRLIEVRLLAMDPLPSAKHWRWKKTNCIVKVANQKWRKTTPLQMKVDTKRRWDTIWTWWRGFPCFNANVAISRNGDAFISQWELRLHISAFEDNPQLNVNTLHWRNYKDCQKDCQTWAHLHVTCSLISSAGVNFPDLS
jgi:hypothetical protein